MPVRNTLLLAVLTCVAALSSPAYAATDIAVTLKPLNRDGALVAVDVLETVRGHGAAAGEALFVVPRRITFTPGQDYKPEDVSASDEVGELKLQLVNVPAPQGAPVEMQVFSPSRSTVGAVSLAYKAKVLPSMAPRAPGPAFDLRGTEGALGGAFFSFLLLPPQPTKVTFSLRWDMSSAGAGSLGVSTSGVSDYQLETDVDAIRSTLLLAGRLQRFVSEGGLFSSYWFGTPPFDPERASAWASKTFDRLRSRFHDQAASPYTLLMRPYRLPRDGGVAARGGFMLEYGLGYMRDSSRRVMFTHEMVHHFIGQLDGNLSEEAWYGEGLAEFYKLAVPMRSGSLSPSDAAHEIAVMTETYYQSNFVSLSIAEAGRQRWADRSIQTVPYSRGFMYFVDLNEKLVRRSSGKESLDTLVLAMLERRRTGRSYDLAAWRELVRAHLGKAGLHDLDNMLAGQLLVPAAGAFGACFQRNAKQAPRNVLGFDELSVLVTPRVIKGLVAGSAAAEAGLLDGDAVLSYYGIQERVAHSAANVVLDPSVTLVVEREGQPKTVSFSTQGPKVQQYRWRLAAGAPQSCDLP